MILRPRIVNKYFLAMGSASFIAAKIAQLAKALRCDRNLGARN